MQIPAIASNVLAFSPDGQFLVTAGEEQAVKIWNTKTARLETTLPLDFTPTTEAFSPDGRLLAVASSRKRSRILEKTEPIAIVLLELTTFKPNRLLGGTSDPVFALAFSPDGSTLASGHMASDTWGLIRIWDVGTGKLVGLIEHKLRWQISSLSFSPDGKSLAVGSDIRGSTEVILWNVASKAKAATFGCPIDGVESLSFSPDGKLLLAGVADTSNCVRLWDIRTGENRAAVIHFQGRNHTVSFSDIGRPFASDTDDQKARIWDVVTGEEVLSLLHQGTSIHRVAFRRDRVGIATVCRGKSVKIWTRGDQESMS